MTGPPSPPPPENRYTALATPAELKLWHQTFVMFARDGGGDVDLRELGLMFRQLGQAPTEKEMKLLIEEVDADVSGTIDFEEFCCLMLRQDRSTRTPTWLADLLPADVDEDVIETLPEHALLSDARFEAARLIQKRLKGGKRSAAEVAGVVPRGRPSQQHIVQEGAHPETEAARARGQ